jgi:hypothetical protein
VRERYGDSNERHDGAGGAAQRAHEGAREGERLPTPTTEFLSVVRLAVGMTGVERAGS